MHRKNYSLRLILVDAEMDVPRHISVLDTSIWATTNMGLREYNLHQLWLQIIKRSVSDHHIKLVMIMQMQIWHNLRRMSTEVIRFTKILAQTCSKPWSTFQSKQPIQINKANTSHISPYIQSKDYQLSAEDKESSIHDVHLELSNDQTDKQGRQTASWII